MRHFESFISQAGMEKRISPMMKTNAMIPQVTARTFDVSKGVSRDREEGVVAKNSHSMKA